jgi:hypothetical protein
MIKVTIIYKTGETQCVEDSDFSEILNALKAEEVSKIVKLELGKGNDKYVRYLSKQGKYMEYDPEEFEETKEFWLKAVEDEQSL